VKKKICFSCFFPPFSSKVWRWVTLTGDPLITQILICHLWNRLLMSKPEISQSKEWLQRENYKVTFSNAFSFTFYYILFLVTKPEI
jgi:hypothetical protein